VCRLSEDEVVLYVCGHGDAGDGCVGLSVSVYGRSDLCMGRAVYW